MGDNQHKPKVPEVTRDDVAMVEESFNETRLPGEQFFAELTLNEGTRMAEVAVRYAAIAKAPGAK